MLIAILLLCFSLNIIRHGDILIGGLNTFLLFLSILFYLQFSKQKILALKSFRFISPLVFLIGAIPLFSYNYDLFVILLAIGVCFLLLLCLVGNRFKKILIFITLLYMIIASFYVNGLIKLPFSLQSNHFIFSDEWIKLYILQMQNEALYVPFKLRLLIFNSSIYLFILFSKMANLYIFKNLYELLLIANLYPLAQGLILDLKEWSRAKTLMVFCMLLVSLITVISRRIEIFNAFSLLAPFLIYFILRGFKVMNKIIYLGLFVLSIVIATSPLT